MAVKAGVHNISSGTSGLIKTTDNVNKGTVLGGGNISGSLFQSKSNRDLAFDVVPSEDYGSKVVALTGTAARPGVQQALGAGGALAYTPRGDNRSTTDTGFLIRGGSPTLLSGKAGTGDILSIPAGDFVRKSIHSKQNTRRYGDLSDMIFDVFGGGLLAADGAAKSTITNRGSESNYINPVSAEAGNSYDSAASPSRSIPGQFFILSTFTGWSNETDVNNDASGGGTGSGPYMDYSAITGG